MIELGQVSADLGEIQQLMEARQWDEAISLLRRAVEERPFDCQALGKLGYALWKKGERQEGAETLERALQLDPDDGEVIKDCVHVFLDAGRSEDARQILEGYLTRNPWDWQMKEFLEGLSKAVPQKRPSCQSNDNGVSTASLLVGLGEEEFEKGKMDRARLCFEMALEKDPGNAKAHNNMGVLAWQVGDLDGALAYFDKALDLAPTDGEILLNAARAVGSAGHGETASELLEIYLAAHPDEKEIWNEYKELILKGAQAWTPDHLDSSVAEIYVEMGRRLLEAGDIQGAAEAFARAVRLDPQNVEGYLRLGRLHLQLNQVEDALPLLEQAEALDGANEEVSKALADARERLTETADAGEGTRLSAALS